MSARSPVQFTYTKGYCPNCDSEIRCTVDWHNKECTYDLPSTCHMNGTCKELLVSAKWEKEEGEEWNHEDGI